jgi:hypothetical protein
MQLHRLAEVVAGLETLADLEENDPQAGADYIEFVKRIASACDEAYTHTGNILTKVVALPNPPSRADYDRISDLLSNVGSHEWFKKVARICAQLRIANDAFAAAMRERQARLATAQPNISSDPTLPVPDPTKQAMSLQVLTAVLKDNEHEFEVEIQNCAFNIQAKLAEGFGKGDISEAKQLAADVKKTIDRLVDEIRLVKSRAEASSSKGARWILRGDEERARRILAEDPYRLHKLNFFILCALLLIGGAVVKALTILQFVLLAAFVLPAFVILNAITLVTSGKIPHATFLELVRLSLIGTFVPLMSRVLGVVGPDGKADASGSRRGKRTDDTNSV